MKNMKNINNYNNDIEESYNSLIKTAQEAKDNGDFEQAISAFKAALEFKPQQIQVMGELCWTYGQVDKYEEMLETAKKALLISQKRISKDNIGRFYFYISQYYKMTDQFEKACDYLALSLFNKPYFLTIYIEKAYCYTKLGKYTEALRMYDIVKDIDPEYANKNEIPIEDYIKFVSMERERNEPWRIELNQGLEYEKNGEYEKANKSFLSAVEQNPKDYFCQFWLLKNEVKLGKDKYELIAIGENLYNLLKEKTSFNVTSFFAEFVCTVLSKCYESIGDSDKAVKYSTYSKVYNRANAAQKAIEENNLEKAIEEYKNALEIDNKCFGAINALIDLYKKMKQPDEAMDYAIMGLKLAKEANDNEKMAYYYFEMGNRLKSSSYDKAVEFLNNAVNLTSEFQKKYNYCIEIGYYYNSKGESAKALEYFNKCIEFVNNGAKDALDINSEIVRLKEILDKDSDLNHFVNHYNIGANYFKEMQFEEAAKEMQIALSLIPQDIDTMDILSRCLYRLRRYDECYDVAYEGFMVCRRDHNYKYYDMFCYNLGNILYNTQRYEKALFFYEEALVKEPYDVDYLYFVGACHKHLNNFEEAVKYFQLAHKVNPDDESIIQQLNFCKDKLSLS